jgi:hypothetical protein
VLTCHLAITTLEIGEIFHQERKNKTEEKMEATQNLSNSKSNLTCGGVGAGSELETTKTI